MSVLPEEALGKLICSVCKRYLSVFPVKVYHNRTVKCGRCSQDDNGGTTSKLYELVAKQLEFPCINRFEGCKEVLPVSEMKKHENTCLSDEHVCPLCPDFKGSSYDLLNHMNVNHTNAALENMLFNIHMDQYLNGETFFYCKNSIFVLVSYRYDADVQQLTLKLEIFGKQHKSQQNVMHKFLLYSIYNKLQCQTGNIRSLEASTVIDVSKHKYPNGIMVCQFKVSDLSVRLNKIKETAIVQCDLSPIKKTAVVQCDLPPIMDKSVNKALLKFTFENLGLFVKDEDHYSDCKYWVGDKLWKLLVKKEESDGDEYLGVYLCQQKVKNKLETCNLDATITLVSSISECISFNFSKIDLLVGYGCPNFTKWNQLFNGYVENDSIELQVLIEVKDNKKCDKCNSLLPVKSGVA